MKPKTSKKIKRIVAREGAMGWKTAVAVIIWILVWGLWFAYKGFKGGLEGFIVFCCYLLIRFIIWAIKTLRE